MGHGSKKCSKPGPRPPGISMDEVKGNGLWPTSHCNLLFDPKDIAALAVFLASHAAKSISGQIMPIDCDMQQKF